MAWNSKLIHDCNLIPKKNKSIDCKLKFYWKILISLKLIYNINISESIDLRIKLCGNGYMITRLEIRVMHQLSKRLWLLCNNIKAYNQSIMRLILPSNLREKYLIHKLAFTLIKCFKLTDTPRALIAILVHLFANSVHWQLCFIDVIITCVKFLF